MNEQPYDRSRDDVGNVLALEHVNLRVPDQPLATLFYVTALGFTRDPFIDFGMRNVWVNVGEQQFHLPTGAAQRFRGTIGLHVPDLDGLCRRLEREAGAFAGTSFDWDAAPDGVQVTCPWGNRFHCEAPDAGRDIPLGIPWLEMHIAPRTATGIARFYRDVLGAPAHADAGIATVSIGRSQQLRFVETDAPIAAYDGHHVAVYIANFSGPHRWLAERGLVTEESGPHQYRFAGLVDPDSGAALTELEHEVRSLHHPMLGRRQVNRDPAQNLQRYRRGRDAIGH
jgi:catechol 2,3-dioxygenase-like lactoylglutathione lyase family enzyme